MLGSGIYTTQATLSPTNAQTVSTVTGGVPVQLTCASAHGLQSGDQVVVSSAASNSVNGMWVVEVVSSTVVKLPGSNAPSAAGTAVIQRRPRKVVDLSAEEAPTLGIFIDATSNPPSDFTLAGLEIEYHELPV